jgi:hypothetical protein
VIAPGLIAVLLALGLLAIPAQTAAESCTSYDTFTVYGADRNLRQIELAAQIESVELAKHYQTPCARFASRGWPVYLSSTEYAHSACGPLARGCHAIALEPYVIVDGSSVDFIHEVLETIADPMLTELHREVCDPYEGYWFPDRWRTRAGVRTAGRQHVRRRVRG